MKTLIGLQQDYIETINAAFARWSINGHMPRIHRGAKRKLREALGKLGFDKEQIALALKDAHDMAELERIADA